MELGSRLVGENMNSAKIPLTLPTQPTSMNFTVTQFKFSTLFLIHDKEIIPSSQVIVRTKLGNT